MTRRLLVLLLAALAGCDPSQPCTWAVPIYVDRCNDGDQAACELMRACAPGHCGTPGAPPCDG